MVGPHLLDVQDDQTSSRALPSVAPPELRLKTFNTMILPKLEYCSAICDPHLKKRHRLPRQCAKVCRKNYHQELVYDFN